MPATLTRVQDLSDADLDLRLTAVFSKRAGASDERKANLARIAADILGEQKVRRDELLGL